MQFSHETKDNTLVFRIEEKKLDTTLAGNVKDELLDLYRDENLSNLVFVLSAVTSIDSSGLSSLLFGRRQASERGGECLLVDLQPKVQSLMKIARLDAVFNTFDNESSAIKSL